MKSGLKMKTEQKGKDDGRRKRWVMWTLLVALQTGLAILIFTAKTCPSPEPASDVVLQTTIQSEKRNSPKVALLFLSAGSIHTEPIWRAFFDAAGKLTVRDPDALMETPEEEPNPFEPATERRTVLSSEGQLDEAACEGQDIKIEAEVDRLMQDAEDIVNVISKQSLFSVYVHPGINYNFPSSSIFHGRETEKRVDTEGASSTFRIVEAEMTLLRAALADPDNQKFVLLSETSIPLYTPEVLYPQLILEEKSRIQACQGQRKNDLKKYDVRMTGQGMRPTMWRKSSPWFSLKRAHVETVLNETVLKHKFENYCNGDKSGTMCSPDEHYIPTTLALHELSSETDCLGKMTLSRPSKADSSLKNNFEVSAKLLKSLRHKGGVCDVDAARRSAFYLFEGIPSDNTCLLRGNSKRVINDIDMDDQDYQGLSQTCALFGREFDETSVRDVIKASLACQGGGLGYWC